MFIIRKLILKFLSTDDADQKASLFEEMILAIRCNLPSSIFMHPIFLVIIYNINQRENIHKFIEATGVNTSTLFTRHKLMEMFFIVNRKESMKSVLFVMEDFYRRYNQYPNIDQDSVCRLILD